MYKFIFFIFLIYGTISKGQTIFNKEFLTDNNYIISNSVLQNKDGTFMVVGIMDTLVNIKQARTAFMKKMDSKGNLIWSKYYSFSDTYSLEFKKVIKTSDDNFIAVGAIDYGFGVSTNFVDVFLCKIDTLGNLIWYKNFGDVGTDVGFDVIEHANGNFTIFSSYGKEVNLLVYNAYQIIETNSNGELLWSKQFYKNDEIEQFPSKFQETSDNGYILVGNCTNPNGLSNAHLIKTNGLGDTLWTQTLYPNVNSELVGVVTNEGNFTIFGNIDSQINDNKPFIANYNNNGTLNWLKKLDKNVMAFSIAKTKDNGFAWLCFPNDATNSKNIVIKTDSLGKELWEKELNLTAVYNPSDIISLKDSSLVAIGYSQNSSQSAFYLSKILDNSTQSIAVNSKLPEFMVSAYPNPFSDNLNLNISEKDISLIDKVFIVNLSGEILYTFSNEIMRNKKIDSLNLPSGIYLIQFSTKNNQQIKPIIITKR